MNDENDPAHVPLVPYEAWRLAIDDADAEYDRIIEAANAEYDRIIEAANAEYDRIIEAANAVYELATARELTEQEKKDQ